MLVNLKVNSMVRDFKSHVCVYVYVHHRMGGGRAYYHFYHQKCIYLSIAEKLSKNEIIF